MKSLTILSFGIIAILIFCVTIETAAIPAFSRKYQTSCTTCHLAFPKLNNFGEAFRFNGFVIPEVDEDFIKEEETKLGAEAYKRVWPNAIWPSSIPGTSPLTVKASHGFNYQRNGEIKTKFTAPTVNLLLAGTFGESVSFYTGFHLFEEGEIGSLGRTYIKFNNLFYDHLPSTHLYFRIGQFIPAAVPFANHRNLTLNSFALNSYFPAQGVGFQAGHVHGGDSGFNLESNQLGAELSGIIGKRFQFGLGLVNGNGPGGENNSAKDGYVRAAVKIGGMAFDGSTGEESGDELSQTDNWREYSARIGFFAYKGGADNQGLSGPEDLEFHRIGGDLSFMLGSLNLYGGFVTGRDRVMDGNILQALDYNLYFVEGDWQLYPWLIGAVRYERANPKGLSSFSRIIPHLTILARANVKLVMEGVVSTGDDIKLQDFQYVMEFAF